jgi:hypothetical protein
MAGGGLIVSKSLFVCWLVVGGEARDGLATFDEDSVAGRGVEET